MALATCLEPFVKLFDGVWVNVRLHEATTGLCQGVVEADGGWIHFGIAALPLATAAA